MTHLDAFPVVIDLAVAWGEMDAYRHVNNIVYFRYFESARIAYFRRIAFSGVEPGGVGPILHSTACRFRIPLTFPDTITVGARVVALHADRFTMAYRVVSHRHGAVAADGEGVIVAFRHDVGAKAALPADVHAAIVDLEATKGHVFP
ncbi:MAG: thioesterase family protein [Vicinamibacterales bacterium]